jgi:hypothetical protein
VSKTWVSKAAGVLLIVTGAIQIVFSIPILVAFLLSDSAGITWAFEAELALIFGPLAVSGVLALVGGISALKSKRWPLVLTSAIAAFLPCAYWLLFVSLLGTSMLTGSIDSLSLPLFFGVLFTFFLAIGTAAITLTLLAKKQFERK